MLPTRTASENGSVVGRILPEFRNWMVAGGSADTGSTPTTTPLSTSSMSTLRIFNPPDSQPLILKAGPLTDRPLHHAVSWHLIRIANPPPWLNQGQRYATPPMGTPYGANVTSAAFPPTETV